MIRIRIVNNINQPVFPVIDMTEEVVWLIEPKEANETYLEKDCQMTMDVLKAKRFETQKNAEIWISVLEDGKNFVARDHIFYIQP